jgi:hypothetical protein
MVPGSERNWIAVNAVEQSSLNKKTKYDNSTLNKINRPVTFAARFAFHAARSLPRADRPCRHCQRANTATAMPFEGLQQGGYNLQ